MVVEKINALLERYKTFVFFDYEFNIDRKPIQASFVITEYDSSSFQLKDECSAYIKTDRKIHPYVKKITKIDDGLLKEKATEYQYFLDDLLSKLNRFSKKVFISFGSEDIKVMYKNKNIQNRKYILFLNEIRKNYLDFKEEFCSHLKDDKGNVLSLMNIGLKEKLDMSNLHDAKADSCTMIKILNKMIEEETGEKDDQIS